MTTSSCSLLLIYRPRKDERLSWLTYSGRFTHKSGHPSAVGRAQDSESSPVKDRRSTAEPRNQPLASSLPFPTHTGLSMALWANKYARQCKSMWQKYTGCPQKKNKSNYFLAQCDQAATKRSNFWHRDLRDNCQSAYDYVFQLTRVMPIPGKTCQTGYILPKSNSALT